MRAAVYKQYGSPEVIQIVDIPIPTIKDDEILVKIMASTVSTADVRARSLSMPKGFGLLGRMVFGLFGPRKTILGSEFAGAVAQVGAAVKRFKVGDKVIGFPGFDLACHSEFKIMNQADRITYLPASLDFAQGAALSFGGTTALHFLRDQAKIQSGQRILIVGALGTVGSAAIQISRYYGAKVSGVCSGQSLERYGSLLEKMGCEQLLDYTKKDYLDGQDPYDVVFDTVGAAGLAEYRHVLKPKAALILGAATLPQILHGAWAGLRGDVKVFFGPSKERLEDLNFLILLAERGHYSPLIDRRFALSDIVEAHRHVDTGRKKGSVVISMEA